MTVESPVREVTDATFASDVIEASRTAPVVVDFWAPWCGPCRVLSPIIEKLAGEYVGKVQVATLNTDENPRTATQFGIQGIPAVKAFRDGKVVDEFVGAQPEPNVRAFFERLLPGEDEGLVEQGQAALESGRLDEAEQAFRKALEENSVQVDAIVGLARILIDRGEREEATKLLARVPKSRRANALRHGMFLEEFARKHEGEDLEGDAREQADDPRSRYRWGVMLAARGQYQEALEELLASVKLDRTFGEGAARQATLALFDILGPEHELTREYQRKLSSLLF